MQALSTSWSDAINTLIKWRVRTLAGLLLAIFAGLAGMALDGLSDRLAPGDVAIVLGSKVHPDGRLSERLRARLDAALSLHRQGVVTYLIVSGGIGTEGVDEALAMKDYLVSQQVPSKAVWVDSQGDTTAATAKNSAALMRLHGWQRAVVVTQYFHITRSRWALQAEGVNVVGQAPAEFFEWRDLYSLPREVAACIAFGLKRWGAALRNP